VIKINLLAVDRERAKRKSTFQLGQKVTIGCSLILVVTALLVGWWYWSLQRDSADLDQQIADAERETVRLRSVIQQVQQFEGRRAQLQQRVTLIEQLRKGQSGPVYLLDQVSRALPDTMWLVDLRQSGAEVVIEGRCTNLNALSDFVSGLEGSNLFQRPVEIIDSQVLPGTAGTPELIRFSVRARLRPVS
jgi:type IV pilus assembly protein PilN